MIINPIVVFYITSGLLIVGALSLNAGNSSPPEVIWISMFVAALAVGNRLMPVRREKTFATTKGLEIDIYCLSVLSLGAALFALHGVPLLSPDPDIARMEFFADGGVLAKGFSLAPTVITISTIMIGGLRRRRAIAYGSLAGLEILLAGNKAALFNIALPVIIGFWCAGRRIPLRVLAVGGVIATALTIFLFATVANQSEVSESAWSLLLSRLTTTNASGLRLCLDYSGSIGTEPALIAFQSLIDRLGGAMSGYPISTGRYLTTVYDNYSSFYDAVWELTVTGYCDSYLVGKTSGVIVYIALMSTAIIWILRRMASTTTVLGNAANTLALLHLFLIYNGGNIAAQLLGFIGQDWILFAALVLLAKLAARLIGSAASSLSASSPIRFSDARDFRAVRRAGVD